MKPSIGRSVHYVLDVSPHAAHREATITDVHEDGTVDLTVSLAPTDFIRIVLSGFVHGQPHYVQEALLHTPRQHVSQSDKHESGTWHQQEMV